MAQSCEAHGETRTRSASAAPDVVLHVLGCRSLQHGMFEDNLVALARICRDQGFALWFVYANEAVPSLRREVEGAGGKVLVVPYSDEASLRGIRAISALVLRIRPAVVHAHFGRPGYVAVAAARAFGVKRIFLTKHHESWPALTQGHAWALRVLARLADQILCVSEGVLREVLSAGVRPGRARVTLFGVDPDHFAPDPRAASEVRSELGIDQAASLVLCASHIGPRKGIDVLIGAWDSLGFMPSSAVLLIAGSEGVLGPKLREQAAASRSAAGIRFLGMRDDIPRLLAASDVFVCPSVSEAGGFVAVEGLCSGTPTVATLTGTVQSLTNEGIFVPVPVNDVDALAGALGEVIADPERYADMGRRAREYVRQHMTIEARMTSLAELYGVSTRRGAEVGDEREAIV